MPPILLSFLSFEQTRPVRSDGALAQLVRAPACHAGGHGFKSRKLRHLLRKALWPSAGGLFFWAIKAILASVSKPYGGNYEEYYGYL